MTHFPARFLGTNLGQIGRQIMPIHAKEALRNVSAGPVIPCKTRRKVDFGFLKFASCYTSRVCEEVSVFVIKVDTSWSGQPASGADWGCSRQGCIPCQMRPSVDRTSIDSGATAPLVQPHHARVSRAARSDVVSCRRGRTGARRRRAPFLSGDGRKTSSWRRNAGGKRTAPRSGARSPQWGDV